MDPRNHYNTVVQPNVAAFLQHYADLRQAFNAAAAADALAAHLYWWCDANNPQQIAGVTRHDDGYREKLAQSNADFALLRDVAKAQKHAKLVRGTPQVSTAAQSVTAGRGYGVGG